MVILRLLLPMLACVPFFIGLARPFLLPGARCYLAAGGLLPAGSALLRLFASRRLKWPETSSWFNDLLDTSDGDGNWKRAVE